MKILENLIDKLRNGKACLNEIKDDQTKLRSDLGELRRVQKKHLLKESRNARENIENFYNARKAAIDFFDEYFPRASGPTFGAQTSSF